MHFALLGLLIIFFVFKENTYTAQTVEVETGQKVISTGPYALVRHPMYGGGLVFILGIPLALGSWWGLPGWFCLCRLWRGEFLMKKDSSRRNCRVMRNIATRSDTDSFRSRGNDRACCI